MEINKKKIGLFVILLVIAGSIFYMTSGGGSNAQNLKKDSQPMLCTNPECNAAFAMTLEEVRETSSKMDAIRGGGFLCSECGKNSAQIAEKCPYCEHVFIPHPRSGDFRDRCPKCGKSKMEEMRKCSGTPLLRQCLFRFMKTKERLYFSKYLVKMQSQSHVEW